MRCSKVLASEIAVTVTNFLENWISWSVDGWKKYRSIYMLGFLITHLWSYCVTNKKTSLVVKGVAIIVRFSFEMENYFLLKICSTILMLWALRFVLEENNKKRNEKETVKFVLKRYCFKMV